MVKEFQLRFEILLIFVILEIFSFNNDKNIQIVITTIEYLFVFIYLMINIKTGISYFISFSLLALGQQNFIIYDSLPSNFWGLRLAGLSFNIIFSIFILLFTIFFKKGSNFLFKKEKNKLFFLFFFFYLFIVGLINLVNSSNYQDNFIQDILTYSPFFIYIILLEILGLEDMIKIIKYSLVLTLVMMILSIVLNKMYQYGVGNFFVLENSFSFIFPFAILVLKSLYTKRQLILLSFIFITLVIMGNVFIGGKQIILLFLILVWFTVKIKRSRLFLIISFFGIYFFIEPIFFFFIEYYSGKVISYKFSQIYVVINEMNLTAAAWTNSSIGNIIAESITLIDYLLKNPLILLFGKGFGGGIPDTFGSLSPWAGASGYSYHDLIRNDFYKLHFPVLEIFLKSGLIGLLLYNYLIFKAFIIKNAYSLLFVLMLLTVFYVNKELLLLTLLFLRTSEEYSNNNSVMRSSTNTDSVVSENVRYVN